MQKNEHTSRFGLHTYFDNLIRPISTFAMYQIVNLHLQIVLLVGNKNGFGSQRGPPGDTIRETPDGLWLQIGVQGAPSGAIMVPLGAQSEPKWCQIGPKWCPYALKLLQKFPKIAPM